MMMMMIIYMLICRLMISVERRVDDDEKDVDLKFDDLEPEEGLCGQEQQTGGGRLCKTIVD